MNFLLGLGREGGYELGRDYGAVRGEFFGPRVVRIEGCHLPWQVLEFLTIDLVDVLVRAEEPGGQNPVSRHLAFLRNYVVEFLYIVGRNVPDPDLVEEVYKAAVGLVGRA